MRFALISVNRRRRQAAQIPDHIQQLKERADTLVVIAARTHSLSLHSDVAVITKVDLAAGC